MNSGQPAAANDRALAYLLLRVTLGLNILMHGLSRILAGQTAFASGLDKMFLKAPLPAWQVHAFGVALPWIEGILGLLLLLGLGTRLALIGGALLIAVLTFGTALIQNWDAAGLQLIYAAIYAALLAFHHWNRYSIDAAIKRGRE
jgi:thiosulfate dehydrogenase [quinone] large subunit